MVLHKQTNNLLEKKVFPKLRTSFEIYPFLLYSISFAPTSYGYCFEFIIKIESPETYSEPTSTPDMKYFAKTVSS